MSRTQYQFKKRLEKIFSRSGRNPIEELHGTKKSSITYSKPSKLRMGILLRSDSELLEDINKIQ